MSETQGEQKPSERSAAARLAARRAAKAARKAAKRGTGPDIPDELTQGVAEASSWLDEHQKEFWGTVAVVSVLAVVFGSFLLSGKKVDSDAAADLSEGITTALSPLGDPPPDDDGTVERFATAEERATRALEQYRNTQRKFPKSSAALFARLGEATSLRQLGKPAEAQKVLAKLVAQRDLHPVLEAQALEGLAFALEDQGNHADASKQFEALGKIQQGAHKPPADYHRARMAMAMGKSDEAIKILKDLVAASADRKDADAPRFDSVVENATLLLQEWGAGPIRAMPTSGSIGSTGAGGAPAPGGGLTQEMIDSLKLQLQGQGVTVEGDKPALTQEIVDALQAKVADGEGDDVTLTKVAAPAAPSIAAPTAAPAAEANAPANEPKPVAAAKPVAATKTAAKAKPAPADKPEPKTEPAPAPPAQAAPAPPAEAAPAEPKPVAVPEPKPEAEAAADGAP